MVMGKGHVELFKVLVYFIMPILCKCKILFN